jgi:1-acyl-sn-glycerol-3-phosphate acyltransferase
MINKNNNERGDTRMAKTKAIPAGPVKITNASLSKLSKVKLEEFAKATYGVDIDRRKKKDDLVKEVLNMSKKTKKVITDASIEAKEVAAVAKTLNEKLAKEAEQTIADIAGISAPQKEVVPEPKKGFWSKLFGW